MQPDQIIHKVPARIHVLKDHSFDIFDKDGLHIGHHPQPSHSEKDALLDDVERAGAGVPNDRAPFTVKFTEHQPKSVAQDDIFEGLGI